jgi:hypothetical protein
MLPGTSLRVHDTCRQPNGRRVPGVLHDPWYEVSDDVMICANDTVSKMFQTQYFVASLPFYVVQSVSTSVSEERIAFIVRFEVSQVGESVRL